MEERHGIGVVSLRCFAAVFGMLLLAKPGWGQTPVAESPISVRMVQRDARLKTSVSLSADRIYLGELLEKISAQTHVTVAMDADDSFSGVEITCELKQTPLSEVMNSLWSLLGNKNGRWEWTPEGSSAQPRYQLHSTPAARMEPGRLNSLKQETFEAAAERMIRIAALKPEERKRAERQLPPSMRTDDPTLHFNPTPDTDIGNFWEGIRLFGTLAPELRRHVLQGQTIDISFDSLSEKDRKAALTLEPSMSGPNTKTRYRYPLVDPDTVRFQVMREGSQEELSLCIGLAGPHSSGVRTYFGTRMAGLYPRTVADWMLPGEREILEREDEPIPTLAELPPTSFWSKTAPLDRNIAQLATIQGASFMAVLPGDRSEGLVVRTGYMPRLLFAMAAQSEHPFMHKWRNGMLLVSYPGWFYGDPGQAPYGAVTRLRDLLKQRNGLLSFQDLVEPLANLTPVQRRRLSAEFPPLRPDVILDRIFALRNRFPELERGVPFDDKMRAALREIGIGFGSLEPEERPVLMHLVDLADRNAAEPQHDYHLQVMTSNQRMIDLTHFQIKRIDPDARPTKGLPYSVPPMFRSQPL